MSVDNRFKIYYFIFKVCIKEITMKYNISIIMLCASVITGGYASNNAPNVNIGIYNQNFNGLHLDLFIGKCADVVNGIWRTMPVQTSLKEDLKAAIAYVNSYHNGRIENDFVRELRDNMQNYRHISPLSGNWVGIDEIIKEGSLYLFRRGYGAKFANFQYLINTRKNLKHVFLLCQIASKMFVDARKSKFSLSSVKSIDDVFRHKFFDMRDEISSCIRLRKIKDGHEQIVFDILHRVNSEEVKRLKSLNSDMYRTGGLYNMAYEPYNLSTYGHRLDYASIAADAQAKLPAVIKEYNEIIDRCGLREHVLDGTYSVEDWK